MVQPILATDYSAQAEVSRKTAASIKRLDILPYVKSGSNVYHPISNVTGEATITGDPEQVKLSPTAPSIDFDHPVTLRILKANTTYRLVAQAKNSGGSQLTSGAVDIPVSTNDAPASQTMTLTIPEFPLVARVDT